MLTQATVAARRGDLERAVSVATNGLALERRSTPSLAMAAGELRQELLTRYSGEKLTNEYEEYLTDLRVV